MRGIPSLITDIRKKVFTEVARMAYQGNGYVYDLGRYGNAFRYDIPLFVLGHLRCF